MPPIEAILPAPLPANPTAAAQFKSASQNLNTATTVLANADSGQVWGKTSATGYLDLMQENFAAAATALKAAVGAMTPGQKNALEKLAIRPGSVLQYIENEGAGKGLVKEFNTPGATLFGGTTAVAIALLFNNASHDALRAADLLS